MTAWTRPSPGSFIHSFIVQICIEVSAVVLWSLVSCVPIQCCAAYWTVDRVSILIQCTGIMLHAYRLPTACILGDWGGGPTVKRTTTASACVPWSAVRSAIFPAPKTRDLAWCPLLSPTLSHPWLSPPLDHCTEHSIQWSIQWIIN